MHNISNQIENKIIVGNYGNDLAIGLQGSPAFIEQQHNRFMNYGAAKTGNSLHAMSDHFAYFLATEEQMLIALEAEAIVCRYGSPLNKTFKGQEGRAFKNTMAQIAKDVFESFERENFMGREDTAIKKAHAVLDGGATFWPSESED
jgi:hypothetical protein